MSILHYGSGRVFTCQGVWVCIGVCHLFLGLTALSLSWFLFDMCCHGKGSTVMAVSQVDDVSDRRQHRSLAAGANDGVSLTHCQQQLRSDDTKNIISGK